MNSITKTNNKQLKNKNELRQLALGTNITDDNLLSSVNSELTPPYTMRQSSTADLVLNIGSAVVQNPVSTKNHAAQPINGAISNFPGSTITFPAASGSNIINSAGSNALLTLAPSMFKKVLISTDSTGVIFIDLGIDKGTVDSANNQSVSSTGPYTIGHFVVRNIGGVIQNVTEDYIYQYSTGGANFNGGISRWVAGTSYLTHNTVWFNDNNIYRCVIANSDLSWNPANWQMLSSGDAIGNLQHWYSGAYYVADVSIVYNVVDNQIYRCVATNSDLTFTSANWVQLSVGVQAWTSGNLYTAGMSVIYLATDNQIYRCIVTNSDLVFDPLKWIKLAPSVQQEETSAGTPINVSTKYGTVQAAINAASALGGGRVMLQVGTYTENIVIPNDIFLEGHGHKTVINGTVTFNGNYSALRAVRIMDNVTFNALTDGNIINSSWLVSGKTVINNGDAGNYYDIISE